MPTHPSDREEKPLAPDATSRAPDKARSTPPATEDEDAEASGKPKVLDPALLPIGDPAGAA